jgi:hypothetical protein
MLSKKRTKSMYRVKKDKLEGWTVVTTKGGLTEDGECIGVVELTDCGHEIWHLGDRHILLPIDERQARELCSHLNKIRKTQTHLQWYVSTIDAKLAATEKKRRS